MGPLVALLAIIGACVLFAYLSFQPQYYPEKGKISIFNWMVLAVCALVCLTWVLMVKSYLAGGPSDKYWKPFAIGGALGFEIIFLGACFILRNFYVFKPPRRPGSGFF
jgi:hypothetical protein